MSMNCMEAAEAQFKTAVSVSTIRTSAVYSMVNGSRRGLFCLMGEKQIRKNWNSF